jgi:hypothetical protein
MPQSHNGCGREDEAREPLCAGGLSGAEKLEDSREERFVGIGSKAILWNGQGIGSAK